MSFESLGLAQPILDAIDALGYEKPSPIQSKAIPPVIEGKDVMAAAQTGTGKTAGFTLPILQHLFSSKKPKHVGNQARVLILTPTRELAAQVAQNVRDYSQNLSVKSVVVFGGVSINPQMKHLRGGADVLIATPGRLLDLHNQKAIQFDKLEVLVLDEADRMLDMGFIHDIRKIIKLLPKKRQNLLFSATFSDEIRQLAKSIVYKPVEVSVTPPNSTVDTVRQSLIAVEKADKTKVLARLIEENDWFQVLVFSRTKHGANRLVKQLGNRDIESMAIHGNKSQGARTRALADFKAGSVRVLVATDIAARGIDIDQLPQVVNFDLPNVAEDYVHRIGRTGRAGASGEAISLVCHDEYKQLIDIERFIKKLIPRVELDGYEPKNVLPESKGDFRDRKPKKPKKQKSSDQVQSESGEHGEKRLSHAGKRGNASNRSRSKNQRNRGSSGNVKKNSKDWNNRRKRTDTATAQSDSVSTSSKRQNSGESQSKSNKRNAENASAKKGASGYKKRSGKTPFSSSKKRQKRSAPGIG